ncbi:MAG TPA: bifunctional riboflavin kinase/FAD synthetase [Acidimicrobiales bacterium]|nr:bifunctional riboflavin kinase/FAD synthetase [Acidimicrobiales bacterium]
MEVLEEPAGCPRPASGTVVTIGAYDGVHLGHRALLARVRSMADQLGSAAAVVTFDRHPATVVRPESAPKLLTDLDQKLELLATTGMDYAYVVHFDEARAAESAEDFVRRLLVDCLSARAVVVGHDFHFGNRRGGNVALLQTMGADFGFDVLGISLVADGPAGEAVSSTRVRRLLAEGDAAGAVALLGRPHEVRGTVVAGDRRGRELGYPTANVVAPGDILLPADGIYAGWYRRPDGDLHPAAISLGRRPTFHPDADVSVLEAYLLDFEGDLYGEQAAVRFTARIRGEERFDSVDALIARMGDDVVATRALLATA